MGKGGPCSFRRSDSSSSSKCRRRRTTVKKPGESPLLLSQQQPRSATPPLSLTAAVATGGNSTKAKKKAVGSRLWMRMDLFGETELFECDKSTIIKRAAIPARDLRILGPLFSQSSNILARDKAMVVNLEFIKVIVTAEEVLLLDPLRQEVLPFVDQLRRHLSRKSHLNTSNIHGEARLAVPELSFPAAGEWLSVPEADGGLQAELPFEFQVLEIALEIVCTHLDSSIAALERHACPVLNELAKSVSTKTLERVRGLKSNLTRLLGRVQKVRDELEHLLDDDEDMKQLYLTRKWLQNQQAETLLGRSGSNSFTNGAHHLCRFSSVKSGSMVTSNNGNNVEDLEMLLEAYFAQLDGTRNKILSVRKNIDDTEDYVNIQLGNKRNELIQLHLVLTIMSFAVAVENLIASLFGMNTPCDLYQIDGVFEGFVGSITAFVVLLFLLILGYARWKKLLGS